MDNPDRELARLRDELRKNTRRLMWTYIVMAFGFFLMTIGGIINLLVGMGVLR